MSDDEFIDTQWIADFWKKDSLRWVRENVVSDPDFQNEVKAVKFPHGAHDRWVKSEFLAWVKKLPRAA